MEQKQNPLGKTAENGEKQTAGEKKIWITPELRLMPVPVVTQSGKRAKTVTENGSYRIGS